MCGKEGTGLEYFQCKHIRSAMFLWNLNRLPLHHGGGCLVCLFVGWLVICLVGWLIGRSVVDLSVVCRSVGWLFGCLVGRLVGWLVVWLVVWLLGCVFAWLFGWLFDWLFAWLVGWRQPLMRMVSWFNTNDLVIISLVRIDVEKFVSSLYHFS